jgi:transcriptional regulator with XRE-family HTH domain
MSLIAKFDGNMNVIGRLLKIYRTNKNLSYEQLSAKLELIGVSIHKQSLYDIENNKRTVKDYELFAIAYVLEIDVNVLFQDMQEQLKKQNI